MLRQGMLTFLLLLSTTVHAQQCESVISLSKLTSNIVSDKSSIEQAASNFCNEYSKSGGKSSSTSFGASYQLLSASYGSSAASVEAVASKYCSASSNYSQANDAYRQYVEAIAPGAFDAYQ